MKLYVYIMPVAFAMACTQGSKFKGAANVAVPKPVAKEENIEPEAGESPGDEPLEKVEPEGPAKPVKAETKTVETTVTAIKIGINFEDTVGGSSDKDHNDAVLCFSGEFNLDTKNTTIVSIKDQTILPTTLSSSDCFHNIIVDITHKDGSKEPTQIFASSLYNEKSKQKNPDMDAKVPPSLTFKKGDSLEVHMVPTTASCDPSFTRDMHNPMYAAVEPNKCRGE